MDCRWLSRGCPMNFKLISNGFICLWSASDLESIRHPNEIQTNMSNAFQMGFRWEFPMGLQWIASGVLMQFQRIADGFRMDFTLIFNRFLMGFQWIPMMSHGFQKNFQCISNGFLMANQWISN